MLAHHIPFWSLRVVVVAIGVVAAVASTIPAAQAASCGSNAFSVSGTFTDKTTGQPLSVQASVRFEGINFGSPGDSTHHATTTQLPQSRYEICLPTNRDAYGVVFSAPGYVSPRGDFDEWIDPTPPSGTHVVINAAQATWEDVFRSEMFFYRSDGLYRAYEPRSDGTLPSPVISGENWPETGDWQFSHMPLAWNGISYWLLAYGPDGSIHAQSDPVSNHESGFQEAYLLGTDVAWDVVTAFDAGDVLFYRQDGSYQVRHVWTDMAGFPGLGGIDLSGTGWTVGWTSIVAIDLDGDREDELLFYRASDGLFRYYHVKSDKTITEPILAGDGYTTGWDAITAVDLDGDGQDEIFFYRDDGLFRFYGIRPDGTLPRPLLAGDGYTSGWTSITQFESCRVHGDWECPFVG